MDNRSLDISDFKHYYPNAKWFIKRYDDKGMYYQRYELYSGNNSEIERRDIILRPLQDMSMDQCRDLAEMKSSAYQCIRNARIWRSGIKFEFQHESSIRRREASFSFDELNGAQIHYLLTRNFDIFNLINAKLAIDQTTL